MLNKLLKLTRPLIFLDVETTSSNVESARICSYAHRVHRPDTDQVGVYYSLVNPLVDIPPETTEIHGITNEMVRDGCSKCGQPVMEHLPGDHTFRRVPTFKDIADNLYRGFQNADFGGYNAKSFDLQVLALEFGRVGLKDFDPNKSNVIDPYKLWLLKHPRKLSDAVQEFCGRTMEKAHNAEMDIQETENVFLGQLKRWPEIGETPEAIHTACFPRNPDWLDDGGTFIFKNGVLCFNFGQNKGKPVANNKGLLKWMLGKSFSPEAKDICRRILGGTTFSR